MKTLHAQYQTDTYYHFVFKTTPSGTAGQSSDDLKPNTEKSDVLNENMKDQEVKKVLKDAKDNPEMTNKIKEEIAKNPSLSETFEKIGKGLATLFEGFSSRLSALFGSEKENSDDDLFDADVDVENLPKNRKAIVQKALDWVKKGTSDGAKHCTNWVTHLYASLGLPNAEAGSASYDGKIVKEGGKYRPTQKASVSDVNKAKPGDYVVIENGNSQTGTHGAIVLANLGGGRLKVASLPNVSGSPKIDVYNLNSGLNPYNTKSKNGERIGNLARIKTPGNIA